MNDNRLTTATPYTETRAPAHDPALRSDVFVPVAWAGVWAIGLSCAAGFVAWKQNGDLLTWMLGALIFGFIGALLVEKLLSLETRWKIETLTGMELTNDNVRGEPTATLMSVNADQSRAAVKQTTQEQACAAEEARLQAFVTRCYLQGTSETAHGIAPHNRAQYSADRELLFELGLAGWTDERNHRLGWQMKTAKPHALTLVKRHVKAK